MLLMHTVHRKHPGSYPGFESLLFYIHIKISIFIHTASKRDPILFLLTVKFRKLIYITSGSVVAVAFPSQCGKHTYTNSSHCSVFCARQALGNLLKRAGESAWLGSKPQKLVENIRYIPCFLGQSCGTTQPLGYAVTELVKHKKNNWSPF